LAQGLISALSFPFNFAKMVSLSIATNGNTNKVSRTTRWADLEDSPGVDHEFQSRELLVPAALVQPCGEEDRSMQEVECSTRAPSECGAEATRDRWADLLSDDDESAVGATRLAVAQPARHTEEKRSTRRGHQASSSSAAASAWKHRDSMRSGPSSAAAASSGGTRRSAAAASGTRASSQKWTDGPKQARSPPPWQASGSAWQGARQGARSSGKKQCQFIVGVEEDKAFRVVRKLLGPSGKHMKDIAEATGAKLRLRGRGSGFKEGPEQVEADEPLMLCISTPEPRGHEVAVRLVRELIEDVHKQYRNFCTASKLPVPELAIKMHDGPREGSY